MLCVLLSGKKQRQMDSESTETKRESMKQPKIDKIFIQKQIETEEMCPVP